MARFHVIRKDEYGQAEIIAEVTQFSKLDMVIKQNVHENNMDNPLTLEDQMNDFQSFYPVVYVQDEDSEELLEADNVIYAGQNLSAEHVFLVHDEEDDSYSKFTLDDLDGYVRFFIGFDESKKTPEGLYVKYLNNEVDKFDHRALDMKTFYYVHKL